MHPIQNQNIVSYFSMKGLYDGIENSIAAVGEKLVAFIESSDLCPPNPFFPCCPKLINRLDNSTLLIKAFLIAKIGINVIEGLLGFAAIASGVMTGNFLLLAGGIALLALSFKLGDNSMQLSIALRDRF
jgi:hypothetical protein